MQSRFNHTTKIEIVFQTGATPRKNGFKLSEIILPIPQIPDGIREAAQRGKLIPFIGAGVSRLAGCPGWPEFADGALKCLVEAGKFSHAQLDQIKHLHPRVKLSIALHLQAEHRITIDFRSLLHPTGRTDHMNGRRLYAALSKMSDVFITTNYDEWLDSKIVLPELAISAPETVSAPQVDQARNVIYKVPEIIPAKLSQPNTVIHIHGCVADPKSMIMTTRDYIQHYANDRGLSATVEGENRVLTFLEHLFREKTVLFIGYGLEELEILEYIIQKARRTPGTQSEARHYLLQGFFRHEHELTRNLTAYYLEDCDIELLSFSKDQKGWYQLIDVVETFARELAPRRMVLEDLKVMEGLLDG